MPEGYKADLLALFYLETSVHLRVRAGSAGRRPPASPGRWRGRS